MMTLLWFIIGLIALIAGARSLVRGASQLALLLGIPPLIIGLTVVAFGTSAPEIAVCGLAAWRGQSDLVLGNIVGSNIFNILLVLGLCASITPLIVKRQLIRWDVPLMIAISLLVWFFAWSGTIGRWEGAVLLLGIAAYTLFTFKKGKEPAVKACTIPLWQQLLLIGVGFVLLAIGAELLIQSATRIAHYFGVSELLIGLTIVALGTSLPEVATSLSALSRGERDLAVGNIIGSNLFNLLGVLGISALISPIKVSPQALTFDLPIMVGVAIATLPIFLTGHRISRWEGILFLFYYVLYLVYLMVETLYQPLLPLFTSALLFFILPLTVLTLIITLVRHYRQGV